MPTEKPQWMRDLLAAVDDSETLSIKTVNSTCGGPNCSCEHSACRAVESHTLRIRKAINTIAKGTQA